MIEQSLAVPDQAHSTVVWLKNYSLSLVISVTSRPKIKWWCPQHVITSQSGVSSQFPFTYAYVVGVKCKMPKSIIWAIVWHHVIRISINGGELLVLWMFGWQLPLSFIIDHVGHGSGTEL